MGGAWFGDPIYLASDSSPPDLNDIRTSTPEEPEQNLYALAWREFEDITPRVIDAICDKDEEIIEILVAKTYIASENEMPCTLLRFLGRAALQHQNFEIEDALRSRFGDDWEEEYKKAEEYWSEFNR